MPSQTTKTDVLILGAGIGGYETFRTLNRLFHRYGIKKEITIVDRNNYFTFTPLLHEVASGAVEPTHAGFPLRELIYRTPHKFLKASVEHIDPEKKVVATDQGDIVYDFCVVALGSVTNYYGITGAAEYAYHTRTLAGAMILRHNLMKALEGPSESIAMTVVGGGYTGVEVAGQLGYFAQHDAKRLYQHKTITVTIIQSADTVVPLLPLSARQLIVQRLTKMGVKILFNTAVQEVKTEAVVLRNGALLPSNFTVWCAGFANTGNSFLNETYCTPNHAVPTTACLTHPNASSLYTVGDIALFTNQGEDRPVPQLGEVAHREGQYVARHIVATLRRQSLAPFRFRSKGMLMPIGDCYGLAIFGRTVVAGLFAWWLRRTVYLMFMPGLLRKLKIVTDWTLHLFGFGYIIAVERNLEGGPKNQ